MNAISWRCPGVAEVGVGRRDAWGAKSFTWPVYEIVNNDPAGEDTFDDCI